MADEKSPFFCQHLDAMFPPETLKPTPQTRGFTAEHGAHLHRWKGGTFVWVERGCICAGRKGVRASSS